MGYLGTKPANAVVTSEQIADGAVSTSDIAANAVTTAKIADANVTQAKLASGVAGTGPAFSASPTTQAYTSNTWTKVALNQEEFDTNNNFDPTTNYRFTPTVAGYYQFNGYIETSGATYVQTAIYKNGSLFKTTQQNSSPFGTTCSAVILMNGSTDYIELYGFMTTSSNIITTTNFSGALVRAA